MQSNIKIILTLLTVAFSHASFEAGATEHLLPTMLAMGDVGQIKNDLAPTDPDSQITWGQLNDEQRQVLAPLGAEWDTLRPWQREKMLGIARDFPKMDTQKKERIQKRLNAWSRMTPFERENARKRYQQFNSLSPEQQDALRKKWAEHQKNRQNSTDPVYSPDIE